MLENPHVALLFIVPGVTDTFRVNGRATIVTDPELLEPCAVEGKVPKLGLRIEIDQAYTHCSKAFLRAKLWDPSGTSTRRAAVAGRADALGRSRRSSRRRTTPSAPSGTRAAKASTDPYRFVDCAYALDRVEAGREAYLAAHIPGASFLGIDELSDLSVEGRGRHPLPGADAFAAAASRAGIGDGVFVVAYDHGGAGGAARLWWLLRHFGHDDVAVLRGGFDAWLGPVRGGEEEIEPARVRPAAAHRRHDRGRRARWRGSASPGSSSSTRARRSATAARSSRSTRSPGRIPGRGQLAVRRGGEIPPARSARPDEIVVYCGSGVTACVDLLALAQAGRPDAKLYPGSWSDWCEASRRRG